METTMTSEIKSTQTGRIRTLNDELRKNFSQGHAVMTTGIVALGAEAVARIVKTVEVYDDFCHANDPYEEHDFGSFEIEGHTVFFKIDYFDCTLSVHSPRSDRSIHHQPRHYYHAGRGILSCLFISCLSDIHHRANEFELIRLISNCVSDNINMFDCTIRHQQSLVREVS
jgi:hypothetical protein